MITNASSSGRANAVSAPEQLSLLPNESVTARFRLSRDTRERGLRHVAEIRQMLAERAAPTPLAVAGDAQLQTTNDQAA